MEAATHSASHCAALRHRAQNADVQVAMPRIAAQAPAEVAVKLARPVAPVDDPEPDEA